MPMEKNHTMNELIEYYCLNIFYSKKGKNIGPSKNSIRFILNHSRVISALNTTYKKNINFIKN